MKITNYLSYEQIKSLSQLSDVMGWRAVLFDWGVISLCLYLCARFPIWPVVLVSMMIIGGRQLGLAILVHETVHRSLFKTRALNDWVGRWLCGAPIWQDLTRYREHHLKHHKLAGSRDDPDFSLVEHFPVTRKSLARKLFRDLIGLTGIKRLYALFLMDFGFLSYTIAADPKRVDQSGQSIADILTSGLKNIYPMIIANLFLFGVFSSFNHSWLYLVWVGSYLTFFSVWLRIRSIAEHAVTDMDLNPVQNTRTTYAHPAARLTIAPHRVNYHLEHHLVMVIPYFNLPKLHSMLKEDNSFKHRFLAEGYWEILKRASSKL